MSGVTANRPADQRSSGRGIPLARDLCLPPRAGPGRGATHMKHLIVPWYSPALATLGAFLLLSLWPAAGASYGSPPWSWSRRSPASSGTSSRRS